MGAALGSAIVVLGAAYGIGKIGASALESMARQPESAGDIRSSMVVSAALIEGVSFFAIIICALAILL
ncbi:MAG TPA: ATP synthase F0 subunit C [Tenuifilaceae bacterium]|nr:ATP synthase F0 subunit C [Tenuifilaceae bacterium]